MTLAWHSELPCLSDSGPQRPEIVPSALGLSDPVDSFLGAGLRIPPMDILTDGVPSLLHLGFLHVLSHS